MGALEDQRPIDFSALYARHSRDVFRFVFYPAGNREDAEDITSETLVRAFAPGGKIEMPTVKSYLFAIARNLFLMGLRSGHRRSRSNDPPGPDLPDSSPGPAELMEHRSALASVWNEVHAMPYEEIALALKISVSSAGGEPQLPRARRRVSRNGRGTPRASAARRLEHPA